MDEYYMDMKVRFQPDESSIQELDKLFKAFNDIKIFGNDENLNNIRKQFDDFAIRTSSLLQAEKMLNQYRATLGKGNDYEDNVTKQLIEYMRQLIGDNEELINKFGKYIDKKDETTNDKSSDTQVMIGNLKTMVLQGLSNIAKSFLSNLANTFTDAWVELDNMLNSLLLTNSTTRENAFTYGFSAAESYGFETAKQMLGIQSEEDLWYMNSDQQEHFVDIMTKYSEKYSQLYDSGFFDKYLDFQIEMQEFKLDMQMEVIEFFMDNKDTIKKFLEFGMSAMEYIIKFVDWIMGNQGPTEHEDRIANVNEYLQSYVSSTHQTVNQSFSNTNSFYGTTDSQREAYLNMLSAQMIEAKRGLEA